MATIRLGRQENGEKVISLANRASQMASAMERKGNYVGAAHMYREAAARLECAGQREEAGQAFLNAARNSRYAGNGTESEELVERWRGLSSDAGKSREVVLHEEGRQRLRDRIMRRILRRQASIGYSRREAIAARSAEADSGAGTGAEAIAASSVVIGEHLRTLSGLSRAGHEDSETATVAELVQDHTRKAVDELLKAALVLNNLSRSRRTQAEYSAAAEDIGREAKVLYEVVYHTVNEQYQRGAMAATEVDAVWRELSRVNLAFGGTAQQEAVSVNAGIGAPRAATFREEVGRVLKKESDAASAVSAMDSGAKGDFIQYLGERGVRDFFAKYFAWRGDIASLEERRATA